MKSVRGTSISGRIETGDTIVSRAKELDTGAVKKKLSAFFATHARYTKSVNAHGTATDAVEKAHADAAAIDGELDPLILEIANHLPSAGLPRANPFSAWGLAAPSKVVELPWDKEAKAATTIATKASKLKNAPGTVKSLAKQIGGLATKLASATKKDGPIDKAETAQSAAASARNVVGVAWERSLAKLKNAALTAEDDGATGLYEALLGNPPPRPKRGPRKAKASQGATPPTT